MAAEKHEIELRHSTGGVFESVERLAAAIQALSAQHHLITPGGAIGGTLPMLHSAAVTFVFADPDEDGYPIPGSSKRGVSKAKLEQIGSAAGVRWIPAQCGQVDEWNDPHRVKYQSAAVVQQLDGTERLIVASKVVDLRAWQDRPQSEWGSDAQEIARIAAAKKDQDGKPAPRDPWPEILGARKNIHANCETKSRLRALRSLGVKTAYEPDEMRKGWAIVRLQFTGHHADPAVERMVAEKIADRALSASGMLYGGAAPRPALPATAAATPGRARPLPETVEPEHDEDGVVIEGEFAEHDATPEDVAPQSVGESASAQPATTPPTPPPAAPASTQPSGPPRPTTDPDLICGPKGEDGKYPRKPCSTFSVKQLESKIKYAEEHRSTWKREYAAKNESELNAMKAWVIYLAAQPKAPKSDEVPF